MKSSSKNTKDFTISTFSPRKKQLSVFYSQWKNNKITNWSHGGKIWMKLKTFSCPDLPFPNAALPRELFYWGKRKIKYCIFDQFGVSYFCKKGNKKLPLNKKLINKKIAKSFSKTVKL